LELSILSNVIDVNGDDDENAGDSGAPGARMADAYERIKTAILRGTFTPGARLSQVKIAERLGLSRTPVREALRLIERDGLITSERGRQVVISSTSMADLDELYALRIKLDCATVRLCVPQLSDDDIAEMQNCLVEMASNTSSDAFAKFDEAHRNFHMIAIRAAGPRHVHYSAQLNEHAERYRRLYIIQASSYRQSKDEHEAIFEACKVRDGQLVSTLLAEHYARIALTIIAQIEPQFEPVLVRSAVRIALESQSGPSRKDKVEAKIASQKHTF
jgi:DNA-binding GntR family transcriptional regulator